MKIKIEEILWEITNTCNRSCDYCGSKEIINCGQDSSLEDKYYIAEEIGKNADKVTISGGEPLFLGQSVLKCITAILKSHNCEVSVVTNGDELCNDHFNFFDLIGISINEESDITKIENLLTEFIDEKHHKKIVFVTNLNKINFHDLEFIVSLASNFQIPIQFQLTMYKEANKAMIDNAAIHTTREKIAELCSFFDVSYILADNLQESHDCSAGINTCGVLYTGDVVPCLSERSWTMPRIQGNVLETPLNIIWRQTFQKCRFEDGFTCCRDCFNYPEPKEDNAIDEMTGDDDIDDVSKALRDALNKVNNRGRDGNMMLYGISQPDTYPMPKESWHTNVMSYGIYNFGNDNRS
jgi:MoaA/NifB/PqqE/SkfB family radical SAM enzyme